MSKNYVDYKVTIWQRLHFTDEADMQEVISTIKEYNTINDACTEELGFIENEVLFDTEEQLPIEENNNQSTIKVYHNNTIIWKNEIQTP